MKPKLTIGMASFNNYTEVWFTIQALRMYQDLTDVELLVVDNYGKDEGLRNFIEGWTRFQARYIEFTERGGTAAPRDLVFKEAKGDFVFCIDSHVLLAPGAVARLKKWIDENSDCTDLLHGPMLYDGLDGVADAMNDEWRDNMWGTWRGGDMDADKEPYSIPMHGMGLFGCRKDSWLGFYSKHKGFGGEEGYIHAKYRSAGRDVLCLPFLQWNHLFRHGPCPYPLQLEDRVHNYVGGLSELGLSLDPVVSMFGDLARREIANLQHSGAEIMPPYGRRESFNHIIDLIKGKDNWNIVEVGTLRTKGNVDGDGYSTPLFAWLAKQTNSTFTSIDINDQSVCKKILAEYGLSDHATLLQQDAMNFTPDRKIDFLYLDGWDWSAESEWSEDCHLEFFQKIEEHLSSEAHVLIDDIHDGVKFIGKGHKLIPYMIRRGWNYVHRGVQALLHRTVEPPVYSKANNGLISCVMITYKRMHCVERSIAMWVAQTYPNAELIIYNTDEENPVVLGDSLKYRNIRVINNNTDYETRRPYDNVGAIRRDALVHAHGDYYICWDDDDIFLPWNNQQCFDNIMGKPDVWAWKPIVSMWQPTKDLIEVAGNAMEASIIVNMEKIREYGFKPHLGGGEHLTWMQAFGEHLVTDPNSIPAYSFNWSDPADIGGHKQSSTIDDDNNFNRHKASCTDTHVRPLELIDVSTIFEQYKTFLTAQPQLDQSLVEKYITKGGE